MNNKIIEVLDYLGEKIGLAIDWSANNVYPQVMEFLTRYRTYEIVTDVLWLIACIAFIFFFSRFMSKTLWPDYKQCISEKKSTKFFTWWRYADDFEMNLGALFGVVFGGFIFIAAVVGTFCAIADIAKWIFIPEAQFYHIIAGLIE